MSGILEQEYLAHYGVKGMRWGYRKSEEATSRDYADAASKMPGLTSSEAIAKRKQTQESFMAKSNPSEAGRFSDRSLSPEQKKALYIGVGVLAAAAVVGGAYAYSRSGNASMPQSAHDYLDQIRKTNSYAFAQGTKPVHPTTLSREGYSLPPGHVFSRVSKEAEKSFASATYTSANPDDYNRYLGEGYGRLIDTMPLHRIQFSAKEEIRIPSFTDTVETLRETMSSVSGRTTTPTEALHEYGRMQGGFFTDTIGSRFLENLKSKGFSAIVDEMDAGRIGDRPLVIIDPTKFTDKVTTQLTPADVLAAQRAMTPLPTPKL